MALDRNSNVDNRKRGPATTKAEVSVPAQWPYCMGEWDAPANKVWTDADQYTTEDDAIENYVPGPVQYNPVSKPVGSRP